MDIVSFEKTSSARPRRFHIKTIVLVGHFHIGTQKMIQMAENLGHPWIGYHVCLECDREESILAKEWKTWVPQTDLIRHENSRRALVEPILEFVKAELKMDPKRFFHVITGRFVPQGRLGH